ncbi:MAG: transglutaminase domain-containing protein [Candidatus Rokubacteria bacterium]|nr:transglutaminase domain-containing protein [Candidatus Rokubacteria bacterium]MBI4627180.1 transglutaminase domain-containing protein [Candidatus Rokubacteria bacterium]
MSTPPFLLGAAVLFWGWQTGLLLFGLAVAVLLEGSRVVTWRLELEPRDFNRVADLCALLFLGGAVYLFATTGTARGVPGGPRAITLLFQWLPLLLVPLVGCQVYSTSRRIPLTAFFWALRRQAARTGAAPGTVDVTHIYVALCVLAASAANVRTLAFYAGLCALAGWALWPARSRRFSPLAWAPLLLVAAVLGWAGHLGLHRLQAALEQTVFEYVFNLVRRDTDPFRASTALGHLGRLKLSERIVLRVEPGPGVRVPLLLREASYDVYSTPAWFASGAGFTPVQPEADGETWKFEPGERVDRAVRVAAYLHRGRGVLTLPAGAFQVDRLAVVGMGRNRLGAVKVEEGLGLVTYTARFGAGAPLDGPPGESDLRLPARDAPVIRRVAAELELGTRAPEDAVRAVTDYFRRGFRYTTWRPERTPAGTPLEEFFLETRKGHCEYFATGTVLLLRAAGVPARYAVGFAVEEWSRLEQRYVVRGRHAHAWALAWVGGAWREVDTTPAVWVDEDSTASVLGPLGDLWAWGGFLFARWRWSEGGDGVGQYVGWLLIPLVLLLAWRLWARRRAGPGARAAAAAPAATRRPGEDSEFYRIERRLAEGGLARRPSEPVTAWIARIREEALAPLVHLHYRYRFDPAGLDAREREALRAGAETWLAGRAAAAPAEER